MSRVRAEKDLCRLACLGVEEENELPRWKGGAEVLLAIESLALTLDDPSARGAALGALARARSERGDGERALELASMAERTGHPSLDAIHLRGRDPAPRLRELLGGIRPGEHRPGVLLAIPEWIRAAAFARTPVDLAFLDRLGERLQSVVLAEVAKTLAETSAREKALERARELLGSDDPFVVSNAVLALDSAKVLSSEDAAAARARLLARGARLETGALPALKLLLRHGPLGVEPDTGDRLADAVLRLALAQRAGEEGDLARGRELLAQLRRDVTELRVKQRYADGMRVFVVVLPLLAAFNPEGVSLVESSLEDPLLGWSFYSSQEVLASFALSVTRLAPRASVFDLVLQTARLALRRIRQENSKKALVLFEGLAHVARAAAWIGRPQFVADLIATGARESLLKAGGLFGAERPFFEYRALLGCGEALAREGQLATLQGAIEALGEPPGELVPFLFDDALEAAIGTDAVPEALSVLEVARRRLEEPAVARWLPLLAARAGDLAGSKIALDNWRRREEWRRRAELSSSLR